MVPFAIGCGDDTVVDNTSGTGGATDSTGTGDTTNPPGTGGTDATDATDSTDATQPTDGTDSTEGTDVTGGTDATDTTDSTDPACACDDKDPCTKDVCKPGGVCEYLPRKTKECAPTIVINSPERGATMTYKETVSVEGTATAPASPVDGVVFQGATIPLNSDGTFEGTLFPDHGINLVVAEVKDKLEQKARAVQAFLMAEEFYPTTAGPSKKAAVHDGLSVFIGKEVWDDDDLSDVDDVATLAHFVLEGLDIMALIPNPITGEGEEPGVGWCEWKVVVKDIQYDVDEVDLDPITNGFKLKATLTDLLVDFSAVAPDFACPDAIGTATSKKVSVVAVVTGQLKPDSTIAFEVESIDVSLDPPVFDITGGFAKLFDWLVNWFADDLAEYVEAAVEDAVQEQLTPVLQSLLNSISTYVKSFEIPSLLGATKPATVTVTVFPTSLKIVDKGAIVGLGIGATTPKGASWLKSPGSIKRSGCFDGTEPPLSMPTSAPLAMAIHDDLINQALFAGWWGGVTSIDIGEEELALVAPELEVEGLEVNLDPLLPPVLTSCTFDGSTQLQLGDVRVEASFLLGGKPAAAVAYVTTGFEVALQVTSAPDATINLTLGIKKLVFLDFHLEDATGAIDGAESLLEVILHDVIANVVVEALAEGFFQSFPVPQFDLASLLPGLPPGTKLAFDPEELTRTHGYIILTGTLVDK